MLPGFPLDPGCSFFALLAAVLCNFHGILRLALYRDAASSSLRTLFPRLDHTFVCEGCHQDCLRYNCAADQWLLLRVGGLLTNLEQIWILSKMPRRRCTVSTSTNTNGVTRGRCQPCYFMSHPTPPRAPTTCGSLIHGDVSADRTPNAHPGPGILGILWPTDKAKEQASLSPRSRETVCAACKTLAENRSRSAPRGGAPDKVTSQPGPAARTAAGAEPALDAVAGAAALSSPTPPDACWPRSAADGTPGPAVPTASGAEEARAAAPGTDGSANPTKSGVGAASGTTACGDIATVIPSAHAAVPAAEADGEIIDLAISTVFAAYGPLVRAADSDGPALSSAGDGAGASPASAGAPAARTRSGADQAASRVRPSVDMAIATVIGAYSTLDEAHSGWSGISSACISRLKSPRNGAPGQATGVTCCTLVRPCPARLSWGAGKLGGGLSRR